MFKFVISLIVVMCVCTQVSAFVSSKMAATAIRMRPVHENFFLGIAEDPAVNTPSQIFGEVAYKSFVEEFDPNALLIGGPKYNAIERIRALKLLTVTAESGLLEALEAKGVTLSKIENLLPVADQLGLLPLLTKNKELVLSLAPLLIEPAPALLPLVVSVIKTSPSTFITTGAALLAAGVFESTDNIFLGAPLVLLGIPVAAVGAVLNTVFGVLTGSSPITISSAPSLPSISLPELPSSRPVARKRPTVVSAKAAPVVAAKAAFENPFAAKAENGKRKLIKVKF